MTTMTAEVRDIAMWRGRGTAAPVLLNAKAAEERLKGGLHALRAPSMLEVAASGATQGRF